MMETDGPLPFLPWAMRTLALLSLVAFPVAAQQAPAAAPLSTFDYDIARPINARDSLRERIDGIAVRVLSFDSPRGGRVTGLLYLPTTSGRHPAMLVGHGAPGDCSGYATMTIGLAMAKSGAVTICLDAPFARKQADPIYLTAQDSTDMVQFIVDWRRGVDYLSARPDVDAERIGYIGNSFGGATGTLLVGVEPRLKAAVLRVADGGWISHFTDPCDTTAVGTAAITGCVTFDRPLNEVPDAERVPWVRSVLPIEGIRFVGRTRAKLLLQNGEQDPLVPPTRARRLKGAVPEGTVQEWYPSGHRLPNEAMYSGLAFLNREIGLARSDPSFEAWLTQRTANPPPSR